MVIAFFLGLGLSFIGSVPPGIINTSVVYITLYRGRRNALIMAAGAAIIEWVQAYAAAILGRRLADYPKIDFWFNLLATIVFVVLSIYYFRFAHPYRQLPNTTTNLQPHYPFIQGMSIAAINFLAIPYWTFYTTWLLANNHLHDDGLTLSIFASGVMIGTFGLLWLYAAWAEWLKRHATAWLRYTHITIGWIFAALAIIQIFKLARG